MARNIPPVQSGGGDDDGLSPHEALGGKVANGLTVEVGILVELYDVAVRSRIRQKFFPGRGY
jgi:hypothetical protein